MEAERMKERVRVPVRVGHHTKTPEGEVKADVVKHLRMRSWLVVFNVQGPFTRGKARGRPDIEAYKDGRVICIETKKPKYRNAAGRIQQAGELTDNQREFIEDLCKAGIRTLVVWTVEEFISDLEKTEREYFGDRAAMGLFPMGE
jgi:Holliday junction resolvase